MRFGQNGPQATRWNEQAKKTSNSWSTKFSYRYAHLVTLILFQGRLTVRHLPVKEKNVSSNLALGAVSVVEVVKAAGCEPVYESAILSRHLSNIN